MGFIILFGIAFIGFSNAGEWSEPYFLDANPDVILESYDAYQRISLDEELSIPFTLTKINYNGEETPTIGAFPIGDNNFLGAIVTKNDFGEWIIEITKRQDYENDHQRIYMFFLNIRLVAEHTIRISVKNIFDNNPILTYYPSPCRVEELKSNFITDCIFDVYDADGMQQNNIIVKLDGNNIVDNMFTFIEYGRETEYNKQYSLKILEELHYEHRAAYNLIVTAHDANNNQGNISAVLEVIDVPNKDPVWIKPLTTETFPEKTKQKFAVKAVDGDTGINKPIFYRLEFIENDYSNLMHIDKETGELNVNAIDRDELDQYIFTFNICAYKFDNESWVIKNIAVFIVEDINDHFPEIDIHPIKIYFLENKYLTLDLQKFIVHDADSGINATYNVSLNQMSEINYTDAFDLMPKSGYQLAKFRISVAKSNLLDFEDEEWRNFVIEIVAQELGDESHITKKELEINLINWNDEKPQFTKNDYVVDIYENAQSGFDVSQVLATDRDVDDHVIHYIVGNTPGMVIDKDSGNITLTEDDVLDYERQKTVILQIMAKDTLVTNYTNILNTVYTQLTINVLDVNDETPVLIMPRVMANVTENSDDYTFITSVIARDPDTTANLMLEILWEKSYATKGGQEAQKKFYDGCLLIEKNDINRNTVEGRLVVNPEFRKKYEIDYEKYDTIFLTLRATDLNQEINIGLREELLTVRVIDENDNAPEFSTGTLTEKRKVVESEELDTVIGSISGFDIDGPGNNNITYALRPIGDVTGVGLVTIDEATGVLKVTNKIQCDIPKIENLEFEITLSDSVHETRGNIQIYIVDINNKVPKIGEFEQQVSIYEDADTGLTIGQIIATDDDRDKPHNVLQYTINNAGSSFIRDLFYINVTNGIISLNIKDGAELDRDNGILFHLINVDVTDNFDNNNQRYGPSNQASTFINVTLLDVNDNAPQMPLKTEFRPQLFEQDLMGTLSQEKIIAPDKDEPNTPNSMVSYEIMSIKPLSGNSENVENYEDVFGIQGDNKVFGQIVARKNLMGYYGAWEIEIKASDHGDPVLFNISTYEINVRPYNFHAPQIVFPIQNKPLRLCMLQEIEKPLLDADCTSGLRAFEAYDPDGGIFGDVNFTLNSDNGDDQYFMIFKENRKRSHLRLKLPTGTGTYKLNIGAVDGDGKISNEQIRNLRVVFIDMQGSPVFTLSEFKTDFTENEEGLLETRFIPAAEDPKNEGIDNKDEVFKMFYFIDVNYRPDDAKLFTLDKETRQLKLITMLDREEVDNHILKVIATNNEDGTTTNPYSLNYLIINITVNDVNDNAPIFNETHYAAGITMKDTRGKHILTYFAYDPDLDDPTSYIIVNDSIRTQGENIEHNKYNMFELNKENGALLLSTPLSSVMKGYFMFDVTAYDTAIPAHFDTISTKIYIIAESNRVKFVFLSGIDIINTNEKYIRTQFEDMYGYETCSIDSIEDIGNQNSRQSEIQFAPITEVVVHFIHNDEAVEATEIQRRSDDLKFISHLQNSFQKRNLILSDVPHSKLEEVQQNLESLLKTTLIAVTVVLVTLCGMLVIAFVMKTRSLNRRIKAFEPPEFGSISSNLHKIGAPTTNIFSIEGSNPIINNKLCNADFKNNLNKKMFNDASTESDEESDFIGIIDDPTFILKNDNKHIMHQNLSTNLNNCDEDFNEAKTKY